MMSSLLVYTAYLSVRLLPLLVVAPISSFRRVPLLVRMVLTLSLALVMASGLHQPSPVEFKLAFLATEFFIGMALAFSFHVISAAAQTMGNVLDMQIGFAAGALFDPNTEQSASPTAELMAMLVAVSLVLLNFHHEILLAFAHLTNILPPGSVIIWSEGWIKILGINFVLAFVVFSPVILAVWFVDVAIAFVSRSLPQAQIYFVGLPLKIFIGILALAWFANQSLIPLNKLLSQALLSWNFLFGV